MLHPGFDDETVHDASVLISRRYGGGGARLRAVGDGGCGEPSASSEAVESRSSSPSIPTSSSSSSSEGIWLGSMARGRGGEVSSCGARCGGMGVFSWIDWMGGLDGTSSDGPGLWF